MKAGSQCGLTVLRQDFFELLIVRVQSGQTLQVHVLLQGRVSEPEHTNTDRSETPSGTKRRPDPRGGSLLCQSLLLVDAHVEVNRLDPEQHAALDLPRQHVEHGSRQRDADVEAVSVPRDDGQHVGGGAAGRLGHLQDDL